MSVLFHVPDCKAISDYECVRQVVTPDILDHVLNYKADQAQYSIIYQQVRFSAARLCSLSWDTMGKVKGVNNLSSSSSLIL